MKHSSNAPWAGQVTPESDQARWRAGFEGTRSKYSARWAYPGDACRVQSPPHKQWLQLQAECLLAGLPASLIDGDDGRPLLVVNLHALTRSFSCLLEAKAWLLRVCLDVGDRHG